MTCKIYAEMLILISIAAEIRSKNYFYIYLYYKEKQIDAYALFSIFISLKFSECQCFSNHKYKVSHIYEKWNS